MTTFPTLIPSTRTYSPGEFPNTAHPLLSGSEIRVRHSNTVLGVRLRLTFQAASSADVLAVRNHYNGRRGGFLPFAIPNELLSGVTTPADFTPAGHQWVYAARPRVIDVPIAGPTPTNRHDLVVELATVPPENTIVAGARFAARVTLQAGSAQRGAFFDVFVSLDAGAASAFTPGAADGVSISVDVTLTAGVASAGSPDPDFSSVSLLLLGDAIIDSGPLGLTMTAEGNAQISTAQSKFTPSSIIFDGTGDRVSTPDNTALKPGGGAFTMEGFIRSAVDPTTYSAQYAHLFGHGNGIALGSYALTLYLGKLYYFWGGSSLAGTSTIAANQWYHVAITRDVLGDLRLFVEGTQEGTVNDGGTTLNATASFNVGDREAGDPGGQYPFNGFIEQVRVTKGVARYTSNFTPPAAPFPTS